MMCPVRRTLLAFVGIISGLPADGLQAQRPPVQLPPTSAATISVRAPAGGGTIVHGATLRIAWSTTGMSGTVPVLITLEGPGDERRRLLEAAAGAGQAEWTVAPSIAPGTYRIALTTREPRAVGRSGNFAVVALGPPAGGRPVGGSPIGTRPTATMPNVLRVSPAGIGLVGGVIAFEGVDLIPALFRARIGDVPLAIANASATRVEARLPGAPITGALTVSHNTSATELVVDAAYRVAGKPTIAAVSPSAMERGGTVTLSGTDLDLAHPHLHGTSGSLRRFVKIGPTGTTSGTHFIQALEWQAAPDGRTATFQAGDAFRIDGGPVLLSPQPSSVTGPLRLAMMGEGGTLSVTGPTVSWTPAMLRIDSIAYPKFGGATVDFLIAGQITTQNLLYVHGTGLNGATISLAGVPLNKSISFDGRSGFVLVPYNSASGVLTAVRGAESVQWPSSIRVVRTPRFAQPDSTLLAVPLDSTIVFGGWDFLPQGVAGLEYVFDAPSYAACNVLPEVERHTANEIRFRMRTTGAVPAMCESTTMFQKESSAYSVLRLVARYGSSERELWQRRFYLRHTWP